MKNISMWSGFQAFKLGYLRIGLCLAKVLFNTESLSNQGSHFWCVAWATKIICFQKTIVFVTSGVVSAGYIASVYLLPSLAQQLEEITPIMSDLLISIIGISDIVGILSGGVIFDLKGVSFWESKYTSNIYFNSPKNSQTITKYQLVQHLYLLREPTCICRNNSKLYSANHRAHLRIMWIVR